MSSIRTTQDQIIENFELLADDREATLFYLMELGDKMPSLAEAYKLDENLIKGCQSKVWLQGEQNDDKVVFTADSDAILTKGIIAILIRTFSNQTASDILESDMDFIDEIGLKEHLSPTRANGLVSMIKNIKMYALAFNSQK